MPRLTPRFTGTAKCSALRQQVCGVQSVETRESSTQRWRFGIFEVDIRNSELRRGGTLVKLREQSFRILVLLLERAGDIVTREELRQGLWPSDTYVDFDHSLNTAIMKLRDALGDSADKPLYIETIPKRGYRFVAPVSVPPPAENVIASSRLDPDSPSDRARCRGNHGMASGTPHVLARFQCGIDRAPHFAGYHRARRRGFAGAFARRTRSRFFMDGREHPRYAQGIGRCGSILSKVARSCR
jgi:DNA-binding winged helix-turn-helix (wHTH) protein